MANWFECKVKQDKNLGDGEIKSVNEDYLIDALSFTEAEARITKEMQPFISGDFTVMAVKKVKVSDIVYDEAGDKWYKVKTNLITIDEKKATEKRTAIFTMVQAPDFAAALDNYTKFMKGTLSDFEIASIIETKIMDVFQADLSGNSAE